ncbi:MAG: ABC transporter permease [Sulfobacillus benefaciens]|uniref:ABC transporter permease n=1 Tax=Sulfobacillus benefaciens TaxID=453960 RepID=A0A2T2X7Z0_9FIRM|nr:MAG: ABC transporter permease [Sulfobacillus benefaciens]
MLFRKLKTYSFIPAVILFLVFLILNSVLSPTFFTISSLSGFFGTYAPLVVLAVGETFVLVGGGIDISLGATVSVVNVLLVTLWGLHWSLSLAIVVSMLAGTAIGVVNGLLISVLKVTPLLATFATSAMGYGAALWIMPTPGGTIATGFANWYSSNYGWFPVAAIFIVLPYVIWAIWRRTRWGTYLFAVGKNEEKSFASGAPVIRVKIFSYVLAAFMASIAGMILTANIVSGDATIGSPDTLSAIAAPVIGGVSLLGGIGDAGGAIFGALFLGLVVNTVFASQVSTFYQSLLTGSIILLGIVITTLIKRLTSMNSRKVVG